MGGWEIENVRLWEVTLLILRFQINIIIQIWTRTYDKNKIEYISLIKYPDQESRNFRSRRVRSAHDKSGKPGFKIQRRMCSYAAVRG